MEYDEEWVADEPKSMTASEEEGGRFSGRRKFLSVLAALGIGTPAFHRALAQEVAEKGDLTKEMIQAAQWVADVKLSEEEQQQVATQLQETLKDQKKLLELEIDADVHPAVVFMPHFFAQPPQVDEEARRRMHTCSIAKSKETSTEKNDEETIPFLSISELGAGLRSGRWTSRKLTELYLARLRKYDPLLHCVINYTDELAMKQAELADQELNQGKDRGPLHGIPWGAKDLIAVPPYKTTWGAAPYRDQIRPHEATVARRLHDAGAVLIAKLSLGTLAWGEKWHDAMTRNPWNPSQGSSGSSAGSASATVSGLCGFSLGSETLGSIVSPTRRCRVTGLRPSFGRVSRYGCMTLAWSMDKIGPIVRHAEDCAPILAAIMGSDGLDPTVVDRPFHWNGIADVAGMRIGIANLNPSELESQAIEKLKEGGAEVVPFQIDSAIPEGALMNALGVESATAHDALIRTSPTEEELGNWGPTFRGAQWERAIPYMRGMRARTLMIQETEKALAKVDVVLGGEDLVRTNLTGHPSMVVAIGNQQVRGLSVPGTLKLTAKLFAEVALLRVGVFLQREIPPTPATPPLEEKLGELKVKS